MKKSYKIGIVGVGSIGKRHLKNIVKVLNDAKILHKIDLIRRMGSQELDTDVMQNICDIYNTYNDAPDDYDVIFVTNPTYVHFDTIKFFTSKCQHMFIEKPVFDSTDVNIDELALKKDCVYYVACPLRHTLVLSYLKENIEPASVISARAICSSYLPDWRQDVDYRNTYSSNANQGGGATLDLLHEWDYLYYLFGKPNKVLNISGKFSNLEIDSDDLSVYIAEYEDKVVEVHLDYFGRAPRRFLEIFTDDETIISDFLKHEILFLKSGKKVTFDDSRHDFHSREIKHFFDIIEKRDTNDNDIMTAFKTLKIAKGII